MAYCNSLRVSPELDLCYEEKRAIGVNITSIYDFTSTSYGVRIVFILIDRGGKCNLNSHQVDICVSVCSLLNFVELR